MSQGPGGGSGGWPTYPGGPSGPDFQAPGGPAYPPRQGLPPGRIPPGRIPPRQKGSGNGPVVAVIIAIVVLAVAGVAVLGASLLGARGSAPVPAPTARPASTNPTGATPSQSATPGRASGPIPSVAPGQPPTGDLKARVDARYGTFETIRRSGTGNQVIDLPAEAAKSVLWMKATGPGWNSVKGVFEDTSTIPLIYGDSARDGVVPIGIDRWVTKRTVQLSVEAKGSWELEIRPISSVPVFTGEASGTGQAVLISDSPARNVLLDYRGTSNFMVTQYGTDGTSHHANEIGDVTLLPATFDAGLSVIVVEAWNMGTWGIQTR